MTIIVKPATLRKNARGVDEAALRISRGAVSSNKEQFHAAGRRFLKNVLALLGVEGDVRSCKGGPAISGEVILHTEHVYVCLGVSPFGGSPEFYYRTCRGMKDYVGGHNRVFSYRRLADEPETFVALIQTMLTTEARHGQVR